MPETQPELGPADSSATEIARRVASGELSPVEVLEAALARIDRLNPAVNAVVTLDDRARAEATALEEALARGVAEPGPLCGVPVGIKDVTPVAGLRTTYGSPIHADHVPEVDALVVERLRRAGAIVIGKTNTPEFAAGAHTVNELFGATRNPWNAALTAGGSTGGGAAALATGMIGIAEGTDLGGSLRVPAAFCGVVGIRPSAGLVPTWPSPSPWDELSVTGPMARTAEDAARALRVMSGPDRRAPAGRVPDHDLERTVDELEVAGLRIAYSPDPVGLGVETEIEAACLATAKRLEAEGARVESPGVDLSEGRKAFLHLRGLWFVTHHAALLPHIDRLGENVRGNLEAGLAVTTEQLSWANGARARIWDFFTELFGRYDFLITPCSAVSPFPLEQGPPTSVAGRPMKTYVDWFAPTFVLSLTGLPVASVPCGLDPDGLPVGLQIVGPPRRDGRVLGLCARIQELVPMPAPDLDALASI